MLLLLKVTATRALKSQRMAYVDVLVPHIKNLFSSSIKPCIIRFSACIC